MGVNVKLFFIVGVTFWVLVLLYSFSKLVTLNGLGYIFEMKDAQEVKTKIIRDSVNINISYTYQVNGKEYNDNYKMFIDYFERCNIDTTIIKYNNVFPMVSYIDGIPLKIRKQKTGIVISTFFLLFLILLWRLINRDKWVRTYEEVGNRPWLYPADTTIKNPLKRFKNRLFKR